MSEIDTKKVAQGMYDLMSCPLCPEDPPVLQDKKQLNKKLWKEHTRNNLVATPQRLEPEAAIACTVCSMIMHMEDLVERAIK